MKILESYCRSVVSMKNQRITDIYIYVFALQYYFALAENNYLLTNHRLFPYTAYYVGRSV